ncbi:MAG: hypothetical protein KAI24_00550 [Planctomycetes bacterium]|nr:hypothetical protein [Planctomycetota bacterium]
MLPAPHARHLASHQGDLARSLRARGREVWPLRRRGADLGMAVTVHRQLPDERTEHARWRAAEPVFLPGVLGDVEQRERDAIDACLQMFDRLRAGDSEFLDELELRLHDDDWLRYAGSTVDKDDPREVERCFVDAELDGEVIAGDLWAKLAWITDDPRDRSLRIRFSNGLDQLEEWMTTSDHTASWVDRFALHAFPECRAVLGCAPLRRRLDRLVAQPHRLSERIVYNNAPDGGAAFHHDAEPGQLGVVFSQLEGRTAWLSISKRRLADLLVRFGWRDRRAAMAALDDACDPSLLEVLNRDAQFARLLAAHGALFVLRAGDAILLPSHGVDDVAWHSVLAIGDRPSLAHSYGVFPRADDYDVGGDPWLAEQPLSTTSR